MKIIRNKFKKSIPSCLNFLIRNYLLRKITAYNFDTYIYKKIVEKGSLYTKEIRYERYKILSDLLIMLQKVLADKKISPNVKKKLIDVFICRIMIKNGNNNTEEFTKKFMQDPPGFITISPCKKCNLNCTGCFVKDSCNASEKLDYEIIDKIISEKTELWNSFFTVISGGEPFLWHSKGKDIIDLCSAHPENYFMIYTNGTLINKDKAERIAEAGNITLAVSLEGFENETDERRGKGVYKKILEAMDNLRNAGAPFGIALTATRSNAARILSDEFLNFFFEEKDALYGWIFQYMPIGPDKNFNLMVTPEQRKWMFEREKQIIHDKNIFLPDFWNGGIYSSGCLAGGRPGGYISIDWNGNVTPCVFYPYSKLNIKEIYSKGGNINDALKSDLMIEIRKWQRNYGFEKKGKEVCNLIAPCGFRDHYDITYNMLKKIKPIAIDEDAKKILNDKSYFDGLLKYDKEFISLTENIWQNDFVCTEYNEHPSKVIIEM